MTQMYFVNFNCTGGISFDSNDEFEVMNYIHDTYPELSNVEITDIKVI